MHCPAGSARSPLLLLSPTRLLMVFRRPRGSVLIVGCGGAAAVALGRPGDGLVARTPIKRGRAHPRGRRSRLDPNDNCSLSSGGLGQSSSATREPSTRRFCGVMLVELLLRAPRRRMLLGLAVCGYFAAATAGLVQLASSLPRAHFMSRRRPTRLGGLSAAGSIRSTQLFILQRVASWAMINRRVSWCASKI